MTEDDQGIALAVLEYGALEAFHLEMLGVPDDDKLDAAISDACNAYDDFQAALSRVERRVKEMDGKDHEIRKALGLDDD